jgi:hypothetical protein
MTHKEEASMTKYLLAFTNPMSPDKEQAYNDWYNGTHLPEVTALPGFRGAKRFKASATQMMGDPQFRYLALYELDDVDTAVAALAKSAPDLTQTDATAPEMQLIVVEEVHEHVPA